MIHVFWFGGAGGGDIGIYGQNANMLIWWEGYASFALEDK